MLKEVAQQLFGHRTQKALDYVMGCKDLHKVRLLIGRSLFISKLLFQTYEFIHAFTEGAIKVCVDIVRKFS